MPTEVLLILPTMALVLTFLNALTMRVVKNHNLSTVDEKISILIPMRNEEKNAALILENVLAQKGLNNFSLSILDDQSADTTGEILKKYQYEYPRKLQVTNGVDLPAGWLGKPWACYQLAQSIEQKDNHYLVFLDADVRLSPYALQSSIQLMNEKCLDFLSPHPQELAEKFLEKIIQPLLQWSWLASVPLRLAERLGIESMTIANGQCLIIRQQTYEAIGGHASVKSEVLEDLALVRTLARKHYRGTVADASNYFSCRMYSSSKELIEGYTKSLWRAFGSPFGAMVATSLLLAIGLAPVISLIYANPLGLIAYCEVAFSFAIAARRTHSSFAAVFLHPLSVLIVICLLIISFYKRGRGRLVWKGRTL